MPLQHAVLALLAARPAHGYELKNEFEQAVGDQWGGLNIGHLYQVLDRLSRDGLIDSERRPQQVKPDRIVHQITPAGQAELDRWLSEPVVRARGYRDDFFLKLMAAVQSGSPDMLAGVLSRQRTHLLRELHGLAEARRAAGLSAVGHGGPGGGFPPVQILLITAAELHTRADLDLVDAAESSLSPQVLAVAAAAARGQQPAADSGAERAEDVKRKPA
jgi:DNA-binding PadR family transcriptional regulator